jgi:UDP-N-acetylmuramate dehydrogenase
MQIQENISLKAYHSFASQEQAAFFTIVSTAAEMEKAIAWAQDKAIPFLVIGAGTNIVFTKNYEGLIIKNEIMGIRKTHEDASHVYLSVGAGENWHHLVSFCIHKSWGGIENLSLIPGTVGAAPIQNIGAYGVEVGETIDTITAFDTLNDHWINIPQADCLFGYRDSIFKQQKNRYLISEVSFKLNKQPHFKTDYGVIRDRLHDMGIKTLSLEAISNAIIHIRSQKLPDPKLIGNAGSFFKNPTVTKEKYEKLQELYPKLVAYPISDNSYKIAAGWLIENCGFKGTRHGNVGCYEKQALVIVSYGIESGQEVYQFSQEIINTVVKTYDIELEREVNIY